MFSCASCGCSDSIKKHGRSCSLASCGCSDSIKKHGRSCSLVLLVVVLTVLKNTAGRVLLLLVVVISLLEMRYVFSCASSLKSSGRRYIRLSFSSDENRKTGS